MEKVGIKERNIVISELTQGKELANELKNQLFHTPTNACDSLLDKIVTSYDNALALLSLLGNGDSSQFAVNNNLLRSPNSTTNSSNGSDPESKNKVHKDVSKKRKTVPKRSEQVRVCTGIGHDDGHSWRKYGQKDILGTIHPRAYYRCTHRHTQGCLATKQVQQTEVDPSIFEVIYRGQHSCTRERLTQNKHRVDTPKKDVKRPKFSLDTLINNELALKVETQELGPKAESFSPFSFPSTPIESENVGSPFFAETSNLTGTSFLPQFLSPETSDSYFSMCQVNDFGAVADMQCFESDFTEIISNPTTNVAFGEWDFSIDQAGLDSHFVDSSDYFS